MNGALAQARPEANGAGSRRWRCARAHAHQAPDGLEFEPGQQRNLVNGRAQVSEVAGVELAGQVERELDEPYDRVVAAPRAGAGCLNDSRSVHH